MATRAIIQISEPISDGTTSSRLFEVKQWPVAIGRALDNDLILVDPFVAPHHARIEQTGDGFSIVALQTDNGVELESGEHIRADEQQPWQEGKLANIGQCRLSLFSEEASLAPEKSLSQASAQLALKKAAAQESSAQVTANSKNPHAVTWQRGLKLIALLLLVITGESFISNNPDVFVLNTIKTAGTFIAGLLVWALVWAILSKVFSGAMRFGAHFFTAVKAVVVMQLVLWHLHIAAFAFSIEILGQFDSILFILLIGWLLVRHLKIALSGNEHTSQRTAKFVQYGVVSLTLGAIALSLGVRYNATGRLTDGLYLTNFMPPSWRLHKAKSPEVLEQGMAELKARTDRQLSKDTGGDSDQETEE
jgi:pSer/pThr/pTyr-binding forkhead associated (FHA) protein